MSRIVIGVVVVLVVAAVGYWYFAGGERAVEQAAAPQAEAPMQQAAQAVQQAAEATQQAVQQAAEATQEAAQQAAEATQETVAAGSATLAQSLSALTVDGNAVGSQVAEAVEGLQSTLTGITDPASAEAAKAGLEETAKKLEALSAQVTQLPDEGRKVLASTLSDMLPTLRAAADRVTAIEGVGPELEPTLQAALGTLEGWARQTG
jgi:cytoskeletal protein RodZ